MRTAENNKLIAEFIGMQETSIGWFDNEEALDLSYTSDNTFDLLEFDKSWEWLIPVVDKIYSSEDYYKFKNATSSQFHDGSIEINTKYIIQTYKAVVEFIKWYNENKG